MNYPTLKSKLQTAKLAILLHEGLQSRRGKTGLALLRYSPSAVVAVIDQEFPGESLVELTGINHDIPIVSSVKEAVPYQPNILAIGIAPSGGLLPPEWREEIRQALSAGMSILNGLHTPLAQDGEFQSLLIPPQMIWDLRQEPPGLSVASAQARHLNCRRILTVGTDMSIGKMSTSIELHRASLRHGLKSQFIGTGQTGIMISGDGIPLDAVRVDFAAGAVEKQVLQDGKDADIVHIEGQGSLLHPGSTATLPLIRGSQPTQLILAHRWGQTHIHNCPDVAIPTLLEVIELYEQVAKVAGGNAGVKVAGIALNTARFSEEEAQKAIEQVSAETGLVCTDVVRFGGEALLEAILGTSP